MHDAEERKTDATSLNCGNAKKNNVRARANDRRLVSPCRNSTLSSCLYTVRHSIRPSVRAWQHSIVIELIVIKLVICSAGLAVR